jgi:hypothetical protein
MEEDEGDNGTVVGVNFVEDKVGGDAASSATSEGARYNLCGLTHKIISSNIY